MQKGSKAKIKWALSAFALTVVVIFLFGSSLLSDNSSSVEVRVSDSFVVDSKVADDASERQSGLAGMQSLAADEGMLFVFEEPGLHGFWMKDMLISIDIIWINSDKKVVHIEENVSPNSYPELTFTPNAEAQYVLEIASGQVQEIGISLGDQFAFDLQ